MAPDLTIISFYEYENWGQGKQAVPPSPGHHVCSCHAWNEIPANVCGQRTFLLCYVDKKCCPLLHPTHHCRHQPISGPKLFLNLQLQKVNCFVESIASALSLKQGCDCIEGGPSPAKATVQPSKLWQVFYQQPTSVTYILMWAIRLLLMRHLRDKRIMLAAQAMVEVQLN